MDPDELFQKFRKALRGNEVEGISQMRLMQMHRAMKARAEAGDADAQLTYGLNLRYGWGQREGRKRILQVVHEGRRTGAP
ncbi:MAG: hypothetical protein M5U25_16240 [Planctomycetota bacterium]|nr:hypothetical protein [Planctomycetota bacterium]